MFHETLIETTDKSYYADRLEKATGKSRRYWSFFPLFELQLLLNQELIKKAQSMEVRCDHKD